MKTLTHASVEPASKEISATPDLLNELTKEQLIERVRAAEQKIADLLAAAGQASVDEQLIRRKMAAGLTREQAITVIRRQREHDAKAE